MMIVVTATYSIYSKNSDTLDIDEDYEFITFEENFIENNFDEDTSSY